MSKSSTYGVIFLTLFLDLIGFSIIFPVFAHLVHYYQMQGSGILHAAFEWIHAAVPQASDDQVAALFGGILFGAYAFLQFLMSPIWGALSDRYGRRPILLISIAGNFISYVLWIFAGNFLVLIIARLLAGAMSGNISTASAAIADVSSEKDRAKGMGLLGAAIGLGFIMGPAIGGLAYSFLPHFGVEGSTAVFALNPFSSLAAIAAVLSLINLIWVWRRFQETLPASQGPVNSERSGWSPFAANLGPDLLRCNLIYLIYMILFAGMESTLVFLAKEQLNYGPGLIASLFVMIGLIGAAIQGGFIRRLVPRLGEKRVLIMGFILQIPGYVALAMIAWGAAGVWIWIGSALLASGSACVMPSASSLVSRNAESDVQGRALGLFRASGSLGRVIGPFLGALCYFFISPAAPYVCGALAIGIPLSLMWSLRQPSLELTDAEK